MTVKKKKLISVAHNFSRLPYGRLESDGVYSGEAFRCKLLYPALQSNETVEVNLDGVLGYGSNWLEEAFGGLIDVHKMMAADLRERLTIVSKNDPSLAREIWMYVNEKRVE